MAPQAYRLGKNHQRRPGSDRRRARRSLRLRSLHRAARQQDAFGVPEQVTAAAGFVEGPTLSPDGRSLYFHRLENGTFKIWRVTR